MQFKRLTEHDSQAFSEVMNIYEKSFPVFEKRALHDHIEALGDEAFHCQIIQNDSLETAGLLFTWETEDFVYVEHFAIAEHLRGLNIGGQILEKMKTLHTCPIILEIEPPIDAISVRRKNFYERHGFVVAAYEHLHPAYKQGDNEFFLTVLAYPALHDDLYSRFYDFFLHRVMYYSFSRKHSI